MLHLVGRARVLILATSLVLALGLAPGAALAQTAGAVTIADFQFTPASLSVPLGTTVTWTNNGPTAHTATDQGVFDSGVLQAGQKFSFTFNTAGTFNYICTIHPSMKGTITVAAASTAASASASPSASTAPSPSAAAASAPPSVAPSPTTATPSAASKPSAAAGSSTAGASAAPVQAPAALPKTGAGGPLLPTWWVVLPLAVLIMAVAVAGKLAAMRR